jgi:hypothetical protein
MLSIFRIPFGVTFYFVDPFAAYCFGSFKNIFEVLKFIGTH